MKPFFGQPTYYTDKFCPQGHPLRLDTQMCDKKCKAKEQGAKRGRYPGKSKSVNRFYDYQ